MSKNLETELDDLLQELFAKEPDLQGPQEDLADLVLEDVSEATREYLCANGPITRHPDLDIADRFGMPYLLGTAAVTLDGLGDPDITGAEFDDRVAAAIALLLLSAVKRRQDDAADAGAQIALSFPV